MTDTENWLTTGEASQVLGVSGIRVRQFCDAGMLKVVITKLGRLIDPESVTALARARAVTAIRDNERTPAVTG